MLTLDETTLYYWSLYSHKDSSSNKKGGIVDWNSSVHAFMPPQNPNLNSKSRAVSRSSKSQVPALTNALTCSSSRSVLTDVVMIMSGNMTIRDPAVQSDGDSVHGGLVDEDETKGAERDEAVSSPVKGHVRMTSMVSTCIVNCLSPVKNSPAFSRTSHRVQGSILLLTVS